MDDFFSGADMNKVSANGGNAGKLGSGVYPALRIDLLKAKKGFHGKRFIVETTVVAEPAQGRDGSPTPLGSSGSWGARIDGDWGHIGIGEAMALVGLLHGMTPDEVDANQDRVKELVFKAIAPENPHEGAIIAAELWEVKTKGGFPIKKAIFSESQSAPVAAASAVAPPPPAPPGAVVPEGGPWYPISGDPRGTFYNAAGDFSTH